MITDFFDYFLIDDTRLALTVADVSGKGVPAALLSSMLQASLRTQIGIVSQDVVLFDDTVAANIRFGRPHADDADVEAAAFMPRPFPIVPGSYPPAASDSR